MQKKAPIAVLVVLTIILMFIIGVRYGQHVEQSNKQNAYVASLTPPPSTPSPEPTEADIQYLTYQNKPCGIEFLYPSLLQKTKETSNSAKFTQDNTTKISFSCDKNASGTAKLNPYNGKRVYFNVVKELQPLVEKTLIFLK